MLALQILFNVNLDWPWWLNVLSVIGALAAVTGVWMGINALRRRKLLALPDEVGPVEMLVFLLTSPALTGFILGDWESAAFGILGNALLLLGAYLTVGFGLLPILRWGARRLIRDATDVLGLFARALPLLLIFVTFLFITAEVWQMAGTLGDPAPRRVDRTVRAGGGGVPDLPAAGRTQRPCNLRSPHAGDRACARRRPPPAWALRPARFEWMRRSDPRNG